MIELLFLADGENPILNRGDILICRGAMDDYCGGKTNILVHNIDVKQRFANMEKTN